MALIRIIAFFSALVALGGARSAERTHSLAPASSPAAASLSSASHLASPLLSSASPTLPALGLPSAAVQAPAHLVSSRQLAAHGSPRAPWSYGYGCRYSGLSPPPAT